MAEESERSKRLKRSKHKNSSTDRISSFPDSLLSQILSLLETKDAVASSILSKRWKFLWASITNLYFDDDEKLFMGLKRTVKRKKLVMQQIHVLRTKFTQFVNRVLLLLNPPFIQKFHLRCHQEYCDPFYLNSWIFAAIGRTTQELDISLGKMEKPMELPLSHFYCSTLAVLKLKGDIHFNFPASSSICFPSLQTLHLSHDITFTIASNSSVNFPKLKTLLFRSINTNEESVNKLFRSCSILENLDIRGIDWDDVFCLIICMPFLRSLKIYLRRYDMDAEGRAYKLQIDTPALQYLDLEGDSMWQYFTAHNLSSLLEATVRIYANSDANSFSSNILKFIEGLSEVRFLSISGVIFQAIRSASADFRPVFHNLTRLELRGKGKCCDWCVVMEDLLHS